VAPGRKLRTDTTVSNVLYPTDSTLLADGIRVLSRSLKRIAPEGKRGALEVVNHRRAVKYRLWEICRAAKSQTPDSQECLKESYQKLLATTGGVVRQAEEIVEKGERGKLKVVGKLLLVQGQITQLRKFLPLGEKVAAQTQERGWKGNTHVGGNVLSFLSRTRR